MSAWPRFLVAGVLLILSAAPAAAVDSMIIANPSVQADGAGEFAFTFYLQVGDGAVGLTGYAVIGLENVEESLWVDTFCIDPQPIEAGSLIPFEAWGRLDDPGADGRVAVESGFCNGGVHQAEVTVLAPAVGPTPTGWSALKACYR